MASASGGLPLDNRYSILENAKDFPDLNKRRKYANLTDLIHGKYLIIENANTNPEQQISKLSVFGIQKALDTIVSNLEKVQRLRNGTLLVLTKNKHQTDTLLKTTKLSSLAEIKVSEHSSLNSSQGTIYCHDIIR